MGRTWKWYGNSATLMLAEKRFYSWSTGSHFGLQGAVGIESPVQQGNKTEGIGGYDTTEGT